MGEGEPAKRWLFHLMAEQHAEYLAYELVLRNASPPAHHSHRPSPVAQRGRPKSHNGAGFRTERTKVLSHKGRCDLRAVFRALAGILPSRRAGRGRRPNAPGRCPNAPQLAHAKVGGMRRLTTTERESALIKETCWSPCGRRDGVVGRPQWLLVTSRTSSWVLPPPKVVFFREAPEAERAERLYCSSTAWADGTSQRRFSTRFSGGCGATGRFSHGRARGDQGARGRPRRRRMGAMWEALGKHIARVLCRISKSKSLRVGGLVDGGQGLQPEREQGLPRTPEGLRQLVASASG